MSGLTPLLEAFKIPADARIDKRVPKKLLLERGAPTAADRRGIQEGIEEIRWVAALKPGNTGIGALKTEEHEYAEIAVVTVVFRSKAKAGRLIELIHRAIPYPVVLFGQQEECVCLALAHKRRSEAEAGRFVLAPGVEATGWMTADDPPPGFEAFRAHLDLTQQPRQDLKECYQGWINCILSLHTAEANGVYRQIDSSEAEEVREVLNSRADLLAEIASLRAAARKERQVNRQVELNLQIKQLEQAAESIKLRI